MFGSYRPQRDPRSGQDQVVVAPLPRDLSLPLALRNRRVPKSEQG